MKIRIYIVQLLLVLVASFILYITNKPDNQNFSINSYVTIALAGLLLVFMVHAIFYIKARWEYFVLKNWLNGLGASDLKRKDDTILLKFDQLELMITYTNNLFKRILGVYLVSLDVPDSKVKLNISGPYVFGLGLDNRTVSVGKRIIIDKFPNAKELREIISELEIKASDWKIV